MILHRVVVAALVVAAVAGPATGSPQRGRQSPFTMGMRFLENLRHGMTSTFQNLFGSSQGREGSRPPPKRAPNLDPAPPAVHKPESQSQPIHEESHGAPPFQSHASPASSQHFPPGSTFSSNGPPSSFFKVVHEKDESTPFPDVHGFSDESFHPDTFLPGPPPFQGTVEEDQLVNVVHDRPRPLPLTHNDLSQDSFPPHKSATSFASFGNTANFKLGGPIKRDEPDGHAPLHPRSILKGPPPQGDGQHAHPSLRLDADVGASDHPTVVSHAHARSATHKPATQVQSTPLERQRREHHVAKKDSASFTDQSPFDSKKIHVARTARDAAAVQSRIVLLL